MLKYRELYDYILGTLYKLKINNNSNFYSLREIILYLKYPSSPEDIYEIGKFLEAEGYVQAEFTLGDVFVKIKPQGIIYIEEKEENFILGFEKYLKSKNVAKKINKIISKLSEKSIKDSRKPILEIVGSINKYFNDTDKLKNSDLHKDVRILKLELEKEHLDKEVILIKLNALQDIRPISALSFDLRNHIIHSLDRI